MRKHLTITLLTALWLVQAHPSEAQSAPASPKGIAGFVEKLEIKSDTTAYGGASFGAVGPYRVIIGIVHGKISPVHPANRGIAGLDRAAVGSDGFVPYTTDFVILRPVNVAAAKRIIFYDVVNRGGKRALSVFNGAGNSFDAGQQGDALLLRQGYTVVWSGWQGDIQQSGNGTRIGAKFPVEINADGSPITGMSPEEEVFDNTNNPATFALSYPAASTDPGQVTFNVRETWTTPKGMTWDSPSEAIPAGNWKFIDERHVSVTRPADMDAGAIYSFVYLAKDPVVMGIGFAAVRDLISFLRFDSADHAGSPNPLNDLKGGLCSRQVGERRMSRKSGHHCGRGDRRGRLTIGTLYARFSVPGVQRRYARA